MINISNKDISFYLELLEEGQNAATYVPFGFAFQVDSGLYLMLKFFDDIKYIEIESKLQDIEFECNNGDLILVQAKASENPNASNCNEKSKLFDAFLSLVKSDNDKVRKLIYVSNLNDPLKINNSTSFDGKIVEYNYLSENEKKVINKCLNDIKNKLNNKISDDKCSTRNKGLSKAIMYKIDNLDLDKICILTIPRYYGDIDREIEIINSLKSFLMTKFGFQDFNADAYGKKIYSLIHNKFDYLSSVSTESKIKKVNKKDFAWFSIVVITENTSPSEALNSLDEFYEDEVANKIQGYSYEFDKYMEFENLTKIITDYTEYRIKEKKDSKCFINEKYEDYLDYFNFISDEEEKRLATKCFLYKICRNASLINKISRGI